MVFGSGTFADAFRGYAYPKPLVSTVKHREAAALSRNLPAPDVASGRPARRRGVPLRRLARGRGTVVVADAARSGRPTSSARRTARPPRSPARPACSPTRRRAVSADEIEDFVARHPTGLREWARFAGVGAIADQVRFEREWTALRAYGRERGVRLIGDVPIYVSDVGADVAAWPELFAQGEVAGAPPDALNANGQHWGNPLYDWPVHRATGYRWWIERFRRVFELVDLSRVDHFRGFVSYWAIPARNKTARHGSWKRGPGAELFHAVEGALGDAAA